MILQLTHATFSTQSLKEIHSGRETGLIDTGPLTGSLFHLVAIGILTICILLFICDLSVLTFGRVHCSGLSR